jgi:hypothetical protein
VGKDGRFAGGDHQRYGADTEFKGCKFGRGGGWGVRKLSMAEKSEIKQ